MIEERPRGVNTNSLKFKQGVEAGLNSTEDTKNWQAGNELGQELKDADTAPENGGAFRKYSSPLFMEDSPGGDQGNAQDEKNETEE